MVWGLIELAHDYVADDTAALYFGVLLKAPALEYSAVETSWLESEYVEVGRIEVRRRKVPKHSYESNP